MQTKNILRVFAITAGILLIPLIAMQFTSEVNWTLMDFVVAGALLVSTGLIYVVIAPKLKTTRQRVLLGLVLLGALGLVWAQLAVGII